ncbi:carboxypeptidase-like regulatory domain-containing protein [uncultured Winogradskyella sp.]|uniref:carboxypeptidase-like regulatory domain-containing protein n=1 Tax=uncultured Winogradskyella sp. TaxID=395353 RepID=UPI002609713F|nr:carboxypeptidase-like regulatory domain-containing protein [uncultured Winogradskyella sp.]
MNKITFKIFVLLIVFPVLCFSQEGTVTGTLTTSSDGLPLPGATIIVKGTTHGVQTDFDGNYSLKCNVGDVIVISYVGMDPKEITVTADMFGTVQKTAVKRVKVKPIETDAYSEALKNKKKERFKIPSIADSKHLYNKKDNYNALHRIKDIQLDSEHVNLTYFNPDIYFQVGVKSNLSFQFVKESNLPKLQSSYSQGATENGSISFLGPETGNIFSYGPNLNTLEFDGSNYIYDNNGRLVTLGNGNGVSSKQYNNSVLNTAISRFTNVYFDVDTDEWTTGLDFSQKNTEDIFGRAQKTNNDLALNFKTLNRNSEELSWKSFVKYSHWKNNQPNINGFRNNLLLNSWVTPVSFNNGQGSVLPDNTQRSFSPTNYNNPEWLFNKKNYDANTLFVANLKNDINIGDDFSIGSQLNYKTAENEQNFGLFTNTVGFENGYLSNKTIKNNSFNAMLDLHYDKYLGDFSIDVRSITRFKNEQLDYTFKESEDFDAFTFSNPNSTTEISNRINRNVLRPHQSVTLKYKRYSKIVFSNTAYISSIQKNKLLLPSSVLKVDLADVLNLDDISYFTLSATSAFDVNEMPLFYNNQSHNSLQLLPSESLGYTSNIDLFINEGLDLEERHDYSFNLDLDFYLWDAYWDFTASYFGSKTNGSVFPVLEGNQFQLQNIADITNKGLELQLDVSERFGSVRWNSSLSFMTNKNKVTKLYSNEERVPIAGFQNVSKNLIVGQPAGVIVGTAFARDTQNNIIIDSNGYPIVDTEQQIIGNPVPDFTLGFSNRFTWKKLKFHFVLDYQKGGDTWNGTQNVLNYFGTSQQSADQRNITNYVFNGVNAQGNTNTIPVDFYNPEDGIENNRFVRYGFSGVAEEAIEDASYLNLRTLELSYDFAKSNYDFFRQVEIGLYAHNLITFTKYRGASPYSSLFDTNSGHNLNFFNTPLMSEVGLKVNLKI